MATVITNKDLFASEVIIHGACGRIAADDVFSSFSVDDRPNVFNPNDVYRKVNWVTVYGIVYTRNLLLCVFASDDLMPEFVKLDSIYLDSMCKVIFVRRIVECLYYSEHFHA